MNKPASSLTEQDFVRLPADRSMADAIVRPSVSYWRDVLRRIRSDKVAIVSLAFLVIIILMAIFAPILSPYGYETTDLLHTNQPPSAEHWFGTDMLGRDIFARVCVGGRVSLLIALVCTCVQVVVGCAYGGIMAYFGGWVDNIMMRITDILYTIPDILLIILLGMALKDPLDKLSTQPGFKWMQTLGPNMISIFIIFALLYWVGMARIVRGQILQLKTLDFVTAAEALGCGKATMIREHLLPNCIGQLIATVMLQIPSAIFTEAFLSYLGIGVSAPMASLGSLTSEALNGITTYPYRVIFPAVLISLIILSFNLFGDGLRDALDPKMKK